MCIRDRAKVTRGVVQIPMVGGTIAFGYNKPGCNLKLTQEQAVQVAMGMIRDWKELGCKPGTLTWVHRSDGSGTTRPSPTPCRPSPRPGPSAPVSP